MFYSTIMDSICIVDKSYGVMSSSVGAVLVSLLNHIGGQFCAPAGIAFAWLDDRGAGTCKASVV